MARRGDTAMLTFGSLFAGIGGFDLGFERAGMKCRWQVEIDPDAQQVLDKRFPGIGQWDDVCTFPPTPAEDWEVDVICGGFPCQDISVAGNGAGLAGERSGLFYEFARIIGILRPGFVVLENVAALLNRGLDTILGCLDELGYDAEWSIIPACAFGSPHPRERLFCIANRHEIGWYWPGRNTHGFNGICEGQWNGKATPHSPEWRDVERWLIKTFSNGDWESSETAIHRMDDGVPDWLDRNGMYGNAVVPQIAEWIGRRIVEAASPSPSH